VSDNFEFPVGVTDTLFVLTRNNSKFKQGIINITSKMIIINESKYIELLEFSKILDGFNINKLNILSINNECKPNTVNIIRTNEESLIMYVEMNSESFIKFLNMDDNFMEYNKNTLYILRNGDFIDIKNLFASISGYECNVGRGGSQKAHILSPLDLRLSSYMMAMFIGNYKELSSLNTFNDLSKDRYLSYMDKPRSNRFVSINLGKDFNNFKG
jgi:hypothetical protein